MLNSQFESTTPFRRSNLKSETYKTLVRIFSLCHDQSYVPRVVQFDTHRGSAGKNDEEGNCNKGQVESEIATSGITQPGSSSAEKGNGVGGHFEGDRTQDRGSAGTQVIMDKMVHTADYNHGCLSLSEDERVMGSTAGVNIEDNGFELEQMNMDDLNSLLYDDRAPVLGDNTSMDVVSLDDHCNGSDTVIPVSNIEQDVDHQRVLVDETGVLTHLRRDSKDCYQKISDSSNLLSFDDTVTSAPNCDEISEENCCQATNSPTEKNGMQCKHTEYIISHDSDSTLNVPKPLSEHPEIEEGEISDGSGMEEVSLNVHLKDSEMSDKLLHKDQECDADKENVDDAGKNKGDGREVGSPPSILGMGDNVVSRREVDDQESDNGKILHVQSQSLEAAKECGYNTSLDDGKAKAYRAEGHLQPALTPPKELVSYDDILMDSSTRDQGIVTTGEPGTVIQNKKKRRPASKESKERKKKKERMKRAKKNRELGVKRLKLQPVLKPKTVSHCRHYLKGRCQEGEKCKFSHDVVPLTKSKPCCHFARKSCMKGDDCPFDHQLSNYPCSNYASKGFCNRGNDCMFSHKLLPKEDFADVSNACKPESGLPVNPCDSNPKNQGIGVGSHGSHASSLSDYMRASFKSMKPNALAPPTKSQTLKSERSSINPVVKSLSVFPVKPEMGGPNLKKKDDVGVGNHSRESTPGTIQNANSNSGASPLVPPKGINFLSFGKSSFQRSITKQPASPSNTSSMTAMKHATLPLSKDDNVAFIYRKGQSISEMATKFNEGTSSSQSVVKSKDMKLLSFRKASADDNTREQSGLHPVCTDAKGTTHLSEPSSSSKTHTSSIPWTQLISPITPAQSSEYSMPRLHSNLSNSAQKALSSTLAFAARFEKDIKVKRSDVDFVKDTNATSGTISGGLQNDSAKAMKF